MEAIHLFSLASRKSQWLSVRQATIAENVANANTPGFSARDVQAFDDTLERTRLRLASTAPGHIMPASDPRIDKVRRQDGWGIVHSGNTVSVEEELIKAGSVSREHALATGVVKSFHRMILQSLR